MSHCPSCGAAMSEGARRMCRLVQRHYWYTPEQRQGLPVHIRKAVESDLVSRGLLPTWFKP